MTERQHWFLFQPGSWIGEGDVSFSASPETVRFYTKWDIHEMKDGRISCRQIVEIQGVDEHVINDFVLSEVSDEGFAILLKNDMLETVSGTGLVDTAKIAWEFRGHETFEGFEVYELQEGGEYKLHAEYASPDQFRTIIDGRIWKKET